MENQKIRRSWASLTMLCLIVSQFTTGVFPIPIAPVQSAYAAGFFIEKVRDDAPESEPVGPGDTIRYEITIRNNDNKEANARIIDVVPPELEFVSATNSCQFIPATPGRDDEVVCAEQPLAIGASRSEKITFRVKNNVQECTTIENQADVWNEPANPPQGIPPAWSNVVETPTVCDDPELDIEKEVTRPSSGPIEPGDEVHYKITVENIGTGTANNVEVTDSIPSGLIYQSSTPNVCSANSTTVTCDLGDIDEGDNEDVTIKFIVDPNIQPSDGRCGNDIYNQARANADNADQVTSNSVSTRLECPPAPYLNITKSSSKSEVTKGSNEELVYTIEVENTGNGDATNLYVTDVIPTGLTFNDGASDGRCSQAGSQINCGAFDLDAGDDTSFQLKFTVNNFAPCGNGTIRNTAHLRGNSSNGGIIDTSNQTLTDVLCPQPAMGVSKVVDRSTLTGGSGVQRIVYTIRVTNLGQVPLTNVEVSDTIPTGTTYIDGSSDGRCNQVGNDVECTENSIAIGSNTSFTLAFDIDTDTVCGLTVYNSARVDTNELSETSTNSVQTVISACPVSELRATKVADKTTYEHLEFVTYTINVENIGGVDVTDINVVDVIPSHLMYIDSQSDALCNQSGNAVECGLFDLNIEQDRDIEITFKVLDTAPCGGTISNLGDIYSGNAPDTWTNQEDITVNCPNPELRATKDADKTTYEHLEFVTYTINVENIGNADVTDINVIDIIPSHLMYIDSQSDALCDQSGNAVECGLFDLDMGQDRDIEITFKVLDTAPCGGTISNLGDIYAANAPDTWTNQEDITVNCPNPDFTATKTASVSTVEVGDTFHYTIELTNTGNAELTGLWIIDQIPAGLTYIDAAPSDPDCFQQGNAVKCGDDPIGVGQSDSYDIYFTVNSGAQCGPLNNIAEILFTGNGISGWTNSERIDVLCPEAELEVTKTDNRSTAKVGDTLIYEITVKNTGNADATDVVITDEIPDDTTFESASDNGSKSGDTVTWTIDLDAGESKTLTLKVEVDNSADDGDVIENTACVTGGPCDDDRTTITVDVGSCEDLTISIEADEDEVEPGEEFEFEITVTNPTSTDIEDADITLSISGEDVKIKSVSNGGDEEDDDRVDWDDMDIDANDSITLRVKVEVDDDADDGDEVRGTARTCDDSDSVEVEVEEDDDNDEDIRISINDDPDPIDICHDDDLEYEIRLTNSENSNETVDVVALLDSNTDYQSSSDGGREKNGSRVEWDNVKVSRNSSRELRLRVRVDGDTRDGDTLRLRVGVGGGDSDTEITRVRNRNCNPVDDPPDLTIDKTANTTEALAGSAVSYTITIRNTGGQDVKDAVLTDDYPEQYINITDPGGASDSGGKLTWNLGTLKANSTTVVRYNARLKQGLSHGASVRNTATVRSGTITRTDDHVIVVPTPPVTGLGGFINSFTKSDSYLYEENTTRIGSDTSKMVAVRPQARTIASTANETSGTNLPLMIWITTMLTGLGMGGVFGRKFLFV